MIFVFDVKANVGENKLEVLGNFSDFLKKSVKKGGCQVEGLPGKYYEKVLSVLKLLYLSDDYTIHKRSEKKVFGI